MDSPRRLRPKTSMPHVSSQLGEIQRGNYDARLSLGPAPKPTEYLRPIAIPPCRPSRHIKQSPSMSLLTPANDRWDFGSIRHIRQYSSENKTPISAVDSVFELPSATSAVVFYSPISSTHTSFIAELEDTSPMALRSQEMTTPISPFKSPPISHSSMEFKSSQVTSRAVIKVVDETIAAIEDTNRKLLSRAVAAEETAKLLREQNSELESRIKQYTRPKTAPAQASRKNQPRHRPSHSQTKTPEISEYHDPTPLSTFNAQIDKLLLPAPLKQHARPCDPPPYPKYKSTSPKGLGLDPAAYTNESSIYTPTKLSAPPKHHHRLPPSSHHPHTHSHTRSTSNPATNHLPSHQITKQTSHANLNPNLQLQISPPIPGTISRHVVSLAGTNLSSSQRAKNISLEEARRRAKPLPPLGPMSPSVLRGVVEIGTPRGIDEFGREVKFDDFDVGGKGGRKDREGGGKGMRGFSGFWRWRRERGKVGEGMF